MKKLVVGSERELASRSIIRELGGVERVMMCESGILELRELAGLKDTLVIVASPHSSSKGVPSLSVHTTGNFGPAEFGGEERTLSTAPALYIGEALRFMHRAAEGLPYQVTLEVTHHGPTPDLPMVWVEIGSDERGWRDERAARVAARTIEHLLDVEPEGEARIGVGGPHYAPNFTKLTLQGMNFGHICPKYAVEWLDGEMLEQMVERTRPEPEAVVLDWKGIPGGRRQRLAGQLEGLLRVERV